MFYSYYNTLFYIIKQYFKKNLKVLNNNIINQCFNYSVLVYLRLQYNKIPTTVELLYIETLTNTRSMANPLEASSKWFITAIKLRRVSRKFMDNNLFWNATSGWCRFHEFLIFIRRFQTFARLNFWTEIARGSKQYHRRFYNRSSLSDHAGNFNQAEELVVVHNLYRVFIWKLNMTKLL